MIEVTTLAPHDPMPSGRHVVVLRRLEEDDPDGTAIQIILTGKTEEATHPRRPDGTPMHLDEAIAAARKVAASEGLNRVFVLDRSQGAREQDILRHGGDHSVHMERLQDTNEDGADEDGAEGEADDDGGRGSDMRDIAHRPA